MSQPTQDLSFDAVWKEISNIIDKIYKFQSINMTTYMQIHTLVHNYCTKVPQISTKTIVNNRSNKITKRDGAQIGGEEIYVHIRNYVTNFVQKIFENGANLQGDDVLRFYALQWSKYVFPSKVLNGMCGYINQYWIRRQRDELGASATIYEIFVLTMIIWKDVFDLLNKPVTDACLKSIEADRNHEVINTSLISKVIQSYVALGCCCQTGSQLDIYKQFFEEPFIRHTEEFYRTEASLFLCRNSVTNYLKKVAIRLDEESHRIQSYLHVSTLSILTKTLEDVLIKDQLEVIYMEAKTLLQEEKHQDLTLLFKLVSRVPDALPRLKNIVEEYIHQTGLNAIQRIQENALNNPKSYIETILEVYNKTTKLILVVFENKQDFLLARDSACNKFINRNVITQSTGNNTKSPELLARYCDILLRKGNRGVEESALEEKFDEIIAVFDYMEDKDVFEKFYRNRLAKRLVGGLSASDDHEELMITKLKNKCGYEYTLKMQRMFQDKALSKTFNDQYRAYCQQRHLTDIDFSIMILTYNVWPFSAPPKLVLPTQIQRAMNSVTNFYGEKHSGRKLMWLHQHSGGELHTLFTRPKYILQVSTYQAIILVLFNEQTMWIVEQIHDQTQIPTNVLQQVLSTLLKIKLLTCEQIEQVNDDLRESDIQMNFQMKLSNNFRNKNVRINLNVPLKAVEQKENETVHRTVDEDRKWLIQAAIVRIMKTRQTLKHALLMQEVIQQLSSRFKPQIPQIKKCIDMLIEKEYLERQTNEIDILRYLA